MLDELFKPYGFTISRFGDSKASVISYRVKCSLIPLDMSFSWYNADGHLEPVLKPNIHRFISVLATGAILDSTKVYREKSLLDFIDLYYVKLTPDEKLNGIVEHISSLTSYDGQSIQIKVPNLLKAVQLFYYNVDEWKFYLRNAIKQELVLKKNCLTLENKIYYEYSLTVNGLSKLIAVSEGRKSRYGFIAMAFVDEMFIALEEAIKPALKVCSFEHLIISEQQIASDKTINDAILASIKKAKFTIADFTFHRGGVYFEAGYALGRGQKVIYTCRQDHMENAHFDVRNYQHIVWNDVIDFKKKLIDKIDAFIKD